MAVGKGAAVLALDLGTSTLRAVVTDLEARPRFAATRGVRYAVPRGAPEMAREMDPGRVWRAAAGLVRRALGSAGVGGPDVAAVGVTTQRQGMALLDGKGAEVYVGPNLDLRAIFEGAAIDDAHAELVYRTTGHLPSFMLAPARLRWFQLHRPDLYRRVAAVLTLGDWLAYRLTGGVGAQPVLAGEAGLLDIATGDWARPLMEGLGLGTGCLPPLGRSGEPAGRVSAAAAEATGLRAGTPVVVAGPDTQCGLLGMGVVEPGGAGVVAGWSTAVQVVTPGPAFDGRRRTWVGRHALPGERWVAEASAGDGGNAYRWLKELLAGGGQRGFARMEAAATGVPPGAEGTLAMLGPAALDLSKPGMRPGGLLFPVPMTFSGLGRGHLARAALESIAFAVRGACELLQGVTGSSPTGLSVGGGMALTGLFPRILAGVLGRPVGVADTPHVSAVGAAMMAAASLGDGLPVEELALRARGRMALVEPGPLEAAELEDCYRRWREAARSLAPHWC